MIRLGVIGHGGRMSGMIKAPFRKIAPDLQVVGIVDPDEAGARSRLDECDRKENGPPLTNYLKHDRKAGPRREGRLMACVAALG